MILLVDKPSGMTSQQVVSRIKHAHSTKLKIGHTGTLDPMCTGLLPILIGKDTKLTQFFPHTKSYVTTIQFGIKTTTGDVTGETLSCSSLPTEAEFRTVLPSFVGTYKQIPPMYSAVHVEGKRLYELARMGIEVEREARTVEISDLSFLENLGNGLFRFSVTCSSGTYIRTLCEDIAGEMGLCATMAALRRTQSNGFFLEDASSLEEVVSHAQNGTLDRIALSAEQSLSHLPEITVPQNGETYYCNGGILTSNRFHPPLQNNGLYRAYSVSSRFLGILSFQGGEAKSVFLSEPDSNF